MGNILKSYGYLAAIAGIIITLDQLTKTLVRSSLSFTDMWTPAPWLAPYFRIVHWKNTGAAFGIFQEFGGVFTVLSIIVSIVIIVYFPKISAHDWPLRMAMGLQLGGAVGNLIDRLTIGYVTDFIALLPAWNMPVFNIADASITSGVVVLVVGVWLKEREERRQAETDCQNSTSSLPNGLPEDPCGE